MAVSGENKIAAGKGAHQDQQTRLRKVEICQHRACRLERESRRYKQVGFASHRLQTASLGCCFNGANAGCADTNQAVGGAHPRGVLLLDIEVFFVQVNPRQVLLTKRCECAEADMKGHLRDVGFRGAAGIEHLPSKVQAGRGRRRGAAFFREYRRQLFNFLLFAVI